MCLLSQTRAITIFLISLLTIASCFTTLVVAQDSSEGGPPEEDIEVVLGIDKVIKLDFPFSTKIQIGSPSIIDVIQVPSQKEIIVKGLKAGKSSLTIRNTVGDIKKRFVVQVTVTNNSKVVQELREFLDDVEGLKIDIKGGKVVVGGEIVVPSEIGRIVTILDKYPDVIRLVQLSAQSKRVIARKMQEEIQRSGMKQVTVRLVNDVFWLEGIVSSDNEKALAQKIADYYLPDKISELADKSGEIVRVQSRKPVENFIVINAKAKPTPIPKLIKVISQFVELSKDYGRVFGFKWEPLLAGTGGEITFGRTTQGDVTTKSNATLSGTVSNLFPKLNSARNAGYARILQSGMVVVKNGQPGKINKTTSTPFAVGSGEFQQASNATTGLKLDVTPNILADEQVELAIGIGVSVRAGSVGGNPVTTDNNISTTVVVKSREAAAIGGVVFNQSRTDFDKPSQQTAATGDGETPPNPLFSFIRAKDYTSNKSQFVVFITPEILESASADAQEIKRKFRRRR